MAVGKLAVAAILLAAFGAGLVIGRARPFGALAEGPADPAVAWLRSEKATERGRASRAVLARRSQTIGEIMRIAGETGFRFERENPARRAILLLGELRGAEAVPMLVDRLTLGPFIGVKGGFQGIEDLYPCVGALICIGAPALEPLLDRVAKTEDPRIAALAGYAVRSILRPRVGLAYVQQRAEAEKDAVRRHRLAILQEYVSGKRDPYRTLFLRG